VTDREDKGDMQPLGELHDSEHLPIRRRGHLRLIKGGLEASMRRESDRSLEGIGGPDGRKLSPLLQKAREQHLYVSGLSGVGKTTFLLHLIEDDIRCGRGCCVIDPHGDLVNAVLAALPEDSTNLDRIILFDPSDTAYPIGLNILDATSERTQDLAVQFMIELFEKLYLPDQQGPVLHQAFRNGLRLLMETGGVLPELPQLFTDRGFLTRRLVKVKDSWVRHYFEKVWMKIADSSKGEYLAYFGSKISPLVEDRMLRNILGQAEGLDFARLVDEGMVLLADLSRGKVGNINSRLLGMLLLHKLERATMESSSQTSLFRPPFRVYIDEFHEFVTSSLELFLPAARKFNVGLALAHQRLETLPIRTQELILGSVGSVALFRQGGGETLRTLVPLLAPRFSERDLLSLPNYQALLRTPGEDGRPRLGRVDIAARPRAQLNTRYRIWQNSRERYGQPKVKVEADLLRGFGVRETSDEE